MRPILIHLTPTMGLLHLAPSPSGSKEVDTESPAPAEKRVRYRAECLNVLGGCRTFDANLRSPSRKEFLRPLATGTRLLSKCRVRASLALSMTLGSVGAYPSKRYSRLCVDSHFL